MDKVTEMGKADFLEVISDRLAEVRVVQQAAKGAGKGQGDQHMG